MLKEALRCRLAGQLDGIEWTTGSGVADRMSRRPEINKWSPHEHLAHIACYHLRFLERIRSILTTDRPLFKRYPAEDDPEWPSWQSLTTEEVVARVRKSRRELVDLVSSLSDQELDRVGVHPVFGAVNIPQWLEFFLAHEGHHLYVVMTQAWRAPSSSPAST